MASAGHLLDDDGGPGEANGGTRSDERPPPGRACTLIGCTSAVSERIVRLPPGIRTARVCVVGDCGTPRRVRAAPALVTAPLPPSERRAGNLVSVVVELRDRDGAVTRRIPGIARVRASRPNGPDCPPACFQAGLRLDATGRLRRA